MDSKTHLTGSHTNGNAAQTAIIAFDTYAQTLEIEPSVSYGATPSATSGLQVQVQISQDGGSTYISSGIPNATIKATAANTTAVQLITLNKRGLTPLTHVKVSLTNLDASNVANISLRSQFNK